MSWRPFFVLQNLSIFGKTFFTMKTRFIVLIFLACMIDSFVCNAQNSQCDRQQLDCCVISSGKIPHTDKNIRYDGRVLIDSTAAHLFYPGTSISVTVKNEGSLCAEFSSTGDVFYWIEVDGHEAYKVKSSGLVPLPKQKPPYTVKSRWRRKEFTIILNFTDLFVASKTRSPKYLVQPTRNSNLNS